jgi:hypothetical protein
MVTWRIVRSRALGLVAFASLVVASACGGGSGEPAQQVAVAGQAKLFLHGAELVQNGSFSRGLEGWENWLQDGGKAVFAEKDGRAVVRVKTPATTDWGIQFHTHGLSLAAGKTYRFTFRARADVPAIIDAMVREHNADVNGDGYLWSNYQYSTYTLSAEWATYTVDFTMPLDDRNAGICFFLGQATSKVFIDDVSLVEIVPPPPGTELVDNGDFADKLKGWTTWLQDGGVATFGMKKGAAMVTVTTPASTNWGIELYRGGLPLYAGHRYRFSFAAWAELPVQIRALIHENGHDVNHDGFAYSEYQTAWYSLGAAPQRHSVLFTMPDTNTDAAVLFFYGAAKGKVYVDDVSVVEVAPPAPGSELIQNGTFDAGLDGWSTGTLNDAQATYGAANGEGVVDVTAPAAEYSDVQLSNNGFPLEAGKAYRLTFRARAAAAGWIGTSIWENGNDTNGDGFAWSTYQFDWHEVGPAMTTYQVEFVMPTTNLSAGLCFFLGDLTGKVTLDDVSLVEIAGVPPPPPPPPAGTEILTNGTFDAGVAGWHPYVGYGAQATFTAENGEAVIDTTVASDGVLGAVQIVPAKGFPLYAGKTYRLSFDARSDAWAAIDAVVYENGHDVDGDGSTGTSYVWNWAPLTPTMSTYTVDFTMPVTNPDASLAILTGDVAGRVVLDNLSLVELVTPPPPTPGPELVGNGTFDDGLTGWTTFLMNGGAATYAVENGEAVVSITAAATDYSGIQISYNGLPLEAGKTYRLSFRARADWYRYVETSLWENGHDLDGDGFAWSTYRFDSHYLTPYMTPYTVEFVMPATNSDAGLCFFMGDATGTVVLDDVSVVALQ